MGGHENKYWGVISFNKQEPDGTPGNMQNITVYHGDENIIKCTVDRSLGIDAAFEKLTDNLTEQRNMLDRIEANHKLGAELLEQSLAGLSEQLEPLKKFARQILDDSHDATDIDACDIYDHAVKHGILVKEEIRDDDHLKELRAISEEFEDCEVGDLAYQLVDWLKEPEAPKPEGSITIHKTSNVGTTIDIEKNLMAISAADQVIKKAELTEDIQHYEETGRSYENHYGNPDESESPQ